MVYQSTVFLSRSSISLGLPAIPERLLPLPAIIQSVILVLLVVESARGLVGPGDGSDGTMDGMSIMLVFLLISVEGICGGLA